MVEEELQKIFPAGSGKMAISRGKIHDYLGMKLYFSKEGQVIVMMIPYILEVFQVFNEVDLSGKVSKTPAADNLFCVNKDSHLLDDKYAALFHTTVAKTLFLTKRVRPDIAVAVAFLTTQVKQPSEQYWSKLRRLIRYLQGSYHLSLI